MKVLLIILSLLLSMNVFAYTIVQQDDGMWLVTCKNGSQMSSNNLFEAAQAAENNCNEGVADIFDEDVEVFVDRRSR